MKRRSKLLFLILLGLAGVLSWNAFRTIGVTVATPGHIAGSRTESVPMPQVKGKYGPLVSPVRYQTVSWITYSYAVDGKVYTHETLASKRPPGNTFQVYYDPGHPSWSSLNRPDPPVFSIGFALLALVLAAILAVQGRSQ